MVIGIHKRAVGVFSDRQEAEQALHELKNSSFDMDKVSVIARDADNKDDIAGTQVQEKVGDKADEGAKVGAISGGALGGLTGLLVGLGALAIPGIGPIMLAGATATALATTLAGAGIGAVAGGLVGALVGLGIPEERARVYNERVQRGDYLVIVDGTDTEIAKAEAILNRHDIQEFGIYHQPGQHTNTDVVASAKDTTGYATAPMQGSRRGIGVFPDRQDAEAAITELRDAGFPLKQVSLIAKDSHSNGTNGVDKANKANEGVKAGAATGGVLGGLGGLLVGLGALAIPGVGPVIAGGAVATALATTVAGGTIGAAAGGITGGLVGLGIPEDRARVYSDRFQRGDYLVIVDGNEAEIHQAEIILKRRGIQEFAVYDATNLNREHRQNVNQVRGENLVHNNYSTTRDHEEPAVIIIDHRDERV